MMQTCCHVLDELKPLVGLMQRLQLLQIYQSIFAGDIEAKGCLVALTEQLWQQLHDSMEMYPACGCKQRSARPRHTVWVFWEIWQVSTHTTLH